MLNSRSTMVAGAVLLSIMSLLAVGCSGKNESAAAPTAGAPGAAAAAKPTPEQEAAKARAISEGPAIQAANAAAQSGQ